MGGKNPKQHKAHHLDVLLLPCLVGVTWVTRGGGVREGQVWGCDPQVCSAGAAPGAPVPPVSPVPRWVGLSLCHAQPSDYSSQNYGEYTEEDGRI